jgi:hypothetical protein
VKLVFRVKDWKRTLQIPLDELVHRLKRSFPSLIVDREKGEAHVQEQFDKLVAIDAPPILLNDHQRYFGSTVFVSISEPEWHGVTATAYLQFIRPPLGDAVYFDVSDTNSSLRDAIKRSIAFALDMEACEQ